LLALYLPQTRREHKRLSPMMAAHQHHTRTQKAAVKITLAAASW